MNNCPLCNSEKYKLYIDSSKTHNHAEYYQCSECQLIYIDRKFILSLAEQKKRYLNHRNNSDDLHYRNFHNQLFIPMLPCLQPDFKGLDYGSGADSAIFAMFREKNFDIERYDPIFFNNTNLLQTKYDFIVCTETAEHFINPQKDFSLLNNMLKHNGHIGFMTKLISSKNVLFDSGYIRDDTHISFYSIETFEKIAFYFNWQITYSNNLNAIILKKN